MNDPNDRKDLPQIHPRVVELRSECDQLRAELAKLATDRDELVNTVIPNLTADYLDKVGHGEYQLFCAQVQVRRLKRKIEIIQSAANQGESITPDLVESQLDTEFSQWVEEMDKKHTEIQKARERLASLMGTEDAEDLRKLFRKLAMKLHPDANPDLPAQAKALWLQVLDAFENGNLDEMKVLALLVDDLPDEVEPPSSLDALKKLRDELSKQLRKILENIAELKGDFPYTAMEKLSDPEWVRERQEKSAQQLSESQEQIANLEMIVSGLLGEPADG